MRKATGHNRGRGFTLVEAVAAAALLAVAGTLIGVGVSRALAADADARDFARAAELLDNLMTKVDLIGPGRIEYEGPFEGAADERFTWSISVAPELEADLYSVTVQVQWPSARGLRSAEARTLLNDALDSRNPLLEWDDL